GLVRVQDRPRPRRERRNAEANGPAPDHGEVRAPGDHAALMDVDRKPRRGAARRRDEPERAVEADTMRRVNAPALLAALPALPLSATPATASGLRLTPAKTGAFPERSYLLTLPARAPLSPGQVSIAENGAPVSGLSVVPASTVGQGHFGTVLLIETSASMRGSAINAALGA